MIKSDRVVTTTCPYCGPGLLARDTGTEDIAVLRGDNLPIGVVPAETYKQYTLALNPGDTLLLYSDGITEVFDSRREEFGLQRLIVLFRASRSSALPPTSVLQAPRQQVRNHSGTDVLADDQTALMIEMRPPRHLPRGSIRDRVNPLVVVLPWDLKGLDVLRAQIASGFPFLAQEDLDALVLFSGTWVWAAHLVPALRDFFGSGKGILLWTNPGSQGWRPVGGLRVDTRRLQPVVNTRFIIRGNQSRVLFLPMLRTQDSA